MSLKLRGRPCAVCTHEQRDSIDKALIRPHNASRLAEQYCVGRRAIERHRQNHIAPVVTLAAELEHELDPNSLDLAGQILKLKAAAWQLYEEARQDRSRREAIAALRETRELLVVLAKLQGAFGEGDRKIIDQRTQIVAMVDKLSIDDLRAIANQAVKELPQ